MTTEQAQAILADVEKRQRKADGGIYQTSHRWGIETRFPGGGLCSDSSANRQRAGESFRNSCRLPNASVILYTRKAAGKFGLLEHN
jgi:hypothetical protein